MELYQDRKDEVGLAKIYQRMQRQLGEINQEIRRVTVSQLSREEKRARIDLLNERKARLAKMVEEHRKHHDK